MVPSFHHEPSKIGPIAAASNSISFGRVNPSKTCVSNWLTGVRYRRELRSQCGGRPIRVFYAFDPRRSPPDCSRGAFLVPADSFENMFASTTTSGVAASRSVRSPLPDVPMSKWPMTPSAFDQLAAKASPRRRSNRPVQLPNRRLTVSVSVQERAPVNVLWLGKSGSRS